LKPGAPCDHPSPSLLTWFPHVLVDLNKVLSAGYFDPDLIGVGGNVVVPARVLRSATG
jgi:hypothetical protein